MAIVDLQRQGGVLGAFAGGGGGGGAILSVGGVWVLSGGATTLTAGGWVPIALPGSAALTSDSTADWSLFSAAAGILEYNGANTFSGRIIATIGAFNVSAGPEEFQFRVEKDGATLANNVTVPMLLTPDLRQTTISVALTIDPGEQIQVKTNNVTGTDGLTVERFSLVAVGQQLPAPAPPPSVFLAGEVFTADTTTAALGFKSVYGCTDTAAPRTLTLSSADIAKGSSLQPWVFSVSDQSGGAGANAITIDTEGGELIAGASSIQITENFGSVTLYADGANVFVRS